MLPIQPFSPSGAEEGPSIGTMATDTDDDHEAIADSEVTIVDEVVYKGLTPGEECTITGTLMDKKTGKPVQSDGKDVTATAAFTPEKPSGSVSLSFTFDGSALKGHDIVAFETLSKDGTEVAVHADIEDAGMDREACREAHGDAQGQSVQDGRQRANHPACATRGGGCLRLRNPLPYSKERPHDRQGRIRISQAKAANS